MPEYGPTYNIDSTNLKKFRFMAKDGLKELSYNERYAYGEAVEKAVLAKQKAEARVGLDLTEHRINCASGTNYTTGAEIHKAVRLQQYNSLMGYPSKVRRNRSDIEWRGMYNDAMELKQRNNITQNKPCNKF